MGTLGIQPPQYKVPGNVGDLPKGLTSTLDPSKLKQLSPAQLDAIKNLSPGQLASLNNVPIDQIKNLNPNQLKDFTSKLPNSNEAKNKLDKLQKQIKDRKDKEKKKAEEFEKSVNDKKGFVKEQVKQNSKDLKNTVARLLTPILLQFVRAENIADVLIKKLEKDTRKQLQNKGTLVIDDGQFTFTPSDSGNYTVFKNNFDRRVNNIKRTLTTLQKIITTLNNVIKVLNIALSVIKLFIKVKTKIRLTQQVSVIADLASPSPSKTSGTLLLKINKSLEQLPKDEKKVETYQAAITAAMAFISIFKELISKLKIRIDRLSFNITNSNTVNPTSGVDTAQLSTDLVNASAATPESEDYTSNSGKSYILKLVTLPDGRRQYQALDAFSKFKISQTAPSKVRSNQELLDEIKQILG